MTILLFVKVAEERLSDDCCHLSPLFLLSIGFLYDVLIDTSYCRRQHLLCCHADHILPECKVFSQVIVGVQVGDLQQPCTLMMLFMG